MLKVIIANIRTYSDKLLKLSYRSKAFVPGRTHSDQRTTDTEENKKEEESEDGGDPGEY